MLGLIYRADAFERKALLWKGPRITSPEKYFKGVLQPAMTSMRRGPARLAQHLRLPCFCTRRKAVDMATTFRSLIKRISINLSVFLVHLWLLLGDETLQLAFTILLKDHRRELIKLPHMQIESSDVNLLRKCHRYVFEFVSVLMVRSQPFIIFIIITYYGV